MNPINWRRGFHLKRSKQIAGVLMSHGWTYLTNHAGSTDETIFHFRDTPPQNKAQHLRSALEELGTTFVKLGQILSTRADLLAPEYLNELAKLQDSATPIPCEAIREVLITELGCPIEEAFLDFNPEPVAAASIGQAHAAIRFDGTEVIVKIRRPGVVEQVNEDLEILGELAATASKHWELADHYDLVGLVEEFSQTLRSELDYIREAHNAERFAANFVDDPTIRIPRVFWETTTARILTLERVKGLKINDLEGLTKTGIDRHQLAERATNAVLKMVCEHGFFHADPHPGNFFVQTDGSIDLIDFGMVGILDKRTQDGITDLLVAINQQDADRLVDVFIDLGVTKQRFDRRLFSRDIQNLLEKYWGLPLADLRVTAVLEDIFVVMRRHRLHLPSNLALLLKTVIMIEGVGINLDPTFRFQSVLEPYSSRLILRQYSPLRFIRNLGKASYDVAKLGTEIPSQVRRILSTAELGNLQIGVRPEGFDPIVQRIERLANRIVLGVIAAAFINGLAVLVSAYQPPGWQRWAWLVFAFGLATALLIAAYLAVSILRSQHHR